MTNAAVVFATEHDWPTHFIVPAAADAEGLLRSRYRVLSFFPPRATLEHLYVELAAHTSFATQENEALQFVFGYFSAHGSTGGLTEANGQVFLDPVLCEKLSGAILVLASCLETGDFPAKVTGPGGPVRAVIGFESSLVVGRAQLINSMTGARFAQYRRHYCDVLIEPVRSLLGGSDVQRATEDARNAWSLLRRDPSVPASLEIQSLWQTNAERLRFWGDASAKLP